MNRAVVLFAVLVLLSPCGASGSARARGINTFVVPPPNVLPPPSSSPHVFVQRSGGDLPGGYVDAPQDRVVTAPPLRLTRAGKVLETLRRFLPGGDAPTTLHDPVSGSAIEKFGEAYARSGPMGSGIAPHGNTVD